MQKEPITAQSKCRVAVVCGGQSAEHEVSLASAKNIIAALDPNKYDIYVVRIQHDGKWLLLENIHELTNSGKTVTLALGTEKAFITLDNCLERVPIDVIFPILHGRNGEDGTLQGVLELANLPFVGSKVMGSALCMEKSVSKRLLRAAGILTADWLTIERERFSTSNRDEIIETIGFPLFVKPATTGSSIGISKVKDKNNLEEAIELALQYDHKVIFEQYIAGKEIECSVLGNQNPQASLPGEILSKHEFYDYRAKYLDTEGAMLAIPAQLSKNIIAKIQRVAIQAFKILYCSGLARVDFFVTESGKIYVNELNTLPGFTQISMYPKLWMASGMTYSELIDKLIAFAIEEFNRDRLLSTKFKEVLKSELPH